MAAADKKKSSKANSKSKVVSRIYLNSQIMHPLNGISCTQPAVPQTSILDLLTRKKLPTAESDKASADEDTSSAQESLAGHDAPTGGSSIVPVIASLSKEPLPNSQKKGYRIKCMSPLSVPVDMFPNILHVHSNSQETKI